MQSSEKFILDALSRNDFILTFHAKNVRMPERNVRREDIVECGRTAKNIIKNVSNTTFKVIGKDLDGDKLTVVVGIDNRVVVVTVY